MSTFNKTQLVIQCWNVHNCLYNIDGDRYNKLREGNMMVEYRFDQHWGKYDFFLVQVMLCLLEKIFIKHKFNLA